MFNITLKNVLVDLVQSVEATISTDEKIDVIQEAIKTSASGLNISCAEDKNCLLVYYFKDYDKCKEYLRIGGTGLINPKSIDQIVKSFKILKGEIEAFKVNNFNWLTTPVKIIEI